MGYYLTTAERELQKAGDCTRCGKFDTCRNSGGRCGDCHNLEYYERKAARKAELDAMPRCTACKRRAQCRCAGVYLCNPHFDVVNAAAVRVSPGGLASLFVTPTPEFVRLALAGKIGQPALKLEG